MTEADDIDIHCVPRGSAAPEPGVRLACCLRMSGPAAVTTTYW